jgi:hypothetical protein
VRDREEWNKGAHSDLDEVYRCGYKSRLNLLVLLIHLTDRGSLTLFSQLYFENGKRILMSSCDLNSISLQRDHNITLCTPQHRSASAATIYSAS